MGKLNKFKIVIPSYNNAQWVEPNLASILNQTYTNYEVLYIDDASTDNTFELVNAIVGNNPLFTIRRNPKNMRRGYNTAPKVLEDFFDNDEDILVYVDGDDWLAYPDTLEKMNDFYNQKDPWMTYGKMVVWKGDEDYTWPFPQNSKYPQEVHQQNAYRKDLWRASHLRTFKWHLYKQIKTESLQYTVTNEYYLHAEDLAGSFPCLEMCPPEKIGVVDFLTYVFNESKSNQVRSKERIKEAGQKDKNNGITDMEIEIRHQTPYSVIPLPFDSQQLFKWNRFDLPIKKLFLKFYDKNINSNFGEKIYKEHLRLWNGFKEYNNPNKNTFEAFKNDFINIFKDIKNNNFDWDKSPIIIDENNVPSFSIILFHNPFETKSCGALRFGPVFLISYLYSPSSSFSSKNPVINNPVITGSNLVNGNPALLAAVLISREVIFTISLPARPNLSTRVSGNNFSKSVPCEGICKHSFTKEFK